MSRAVENIKAVHTSDAVFPLSVEQYHEMTRLGVLCDDDPVELIEGVLVFHMPKNPPRRFVTRAIFDAATAMLPAGWHCQMQEPVTLGDGEPEPDISVVRGTPADYRTRHPAAADVAIVMEVSDGTQDRDRGTKYRSYARARIPEYWIIDLTNRCVDIFRQPTGEGEQARYEDSNRCDALQAVPVGLSGSHIGQIDLRELLAPHSG
jgi:Uma2 family endonuclease